MKTQKYYSTFRLLGISLFFAQALQSAVINVSNLNANEGIGSITLDSADITSNTTVTANIKESDGNGVGYGSTNVSFQSNTFNITGLTLDGVGTGDDSITFTLKITALGVTTSTSPLSLTVNENYTMSMDSTTFWGNTGALPGSARNSTTGTLNGGEGLMFSYESGSVILGAGASENYAITFNGFDAVFYDWRADSASGVISLDGVLSTISNPNSDQDIDLAQAQVAIIADEAGRFRMGNLDFSLSVAAAVPEPSTWALFIGLVGLSVVILRRRIA